MVLLEEWMDACGREEKEEGKREERRTEDEGEMTGCHLNGESR